MVSWVITERLIQALLSTWEEGHLLRDGALVVISGRPNVGKSTLLNAMLGKDRAIVTDLPGTTRDTIEEQIIIQGVPIRLVDTAGLRDVECTAERAGVDRARNVLQQADLVVYVVDRSQPLCAEDLAFMRELPPAKTLVVLNKTDLGTRIGSQDVMGHFAVPTSLLDRDGLATLRVAILDKLHFRPDTPPHAVISERHRSLLASASHELAHSLDLIKSDEPMSLSISATCLRRATENIGEITGRLYYHTLLDSIFGRFCIGK